MVETQSSKSPTLRVLSLRDFRLLFGGATTSLLGDQFAFIAIPWLVLQLTGDPLTWMQTRTLKEMLGRMMSLLMFSSIGLVPVSRAISGTVSKWDLDALFASAGALVLLVTPWMAFQPGLTVFSESLVAQQAGEG